MHAIQPNGACTLGVHWVCIPFVKFLTEVLGSVPIGVVNTPVQSVAGLARPSKQRSGKLPATRGLLLLGAHRSPVDLAARGPSFGGSLLGVAPLYDELPDG